MTIQRQDARNSPSVGDATDGSSPQASQLTDSLSDASFATLLPKPNRWGTPFYSREEIYSEEFPEYVQKMMISRSKIRVGVTADGRHIFQQKGEDACGHACAMMFGLDHGKKRGVAESYPSTHGMWSWNVALELVDLRLPTVMTPIITGKSIDPKNYGDSYLESARSQISRNSQHLLQMGPRIHCEWIAIVSHLASLIKSGGPIILNISATLEKHTSGHYVIIDRIGRKDGQAAIDIREPWSGKALSICPLAFLRRLNMPVHDVIQIMALGTG